MDTQLRKDLRAQAQRINVTVHVGKAGLAEPTLDELRRHLKLDKLVKVRLLPSATAGSDDRAQAEALAEAVGAELVEVRGHTAVYWKA